MMFSPSSDGGGGGGRGPNPLADLEGGGSKSARTPASSRRQKIWMILQFAPLMDQISVPVLGGFVVPIVDVECLKKCGVGQ